MKRFMWSFLALLIVACVGVYLAGGFECFAASPGTAGAAIPGDRTKAYITLGILIVAALLFVTEALPLPITAMLVPVGLSSTGVLTSKVAFSYWRQHRSAVHGHVHHRRIDVRHRFCR